MATKQVTVQTISTSLKALGYRETVDSQKPFFEVDGKHIFFYIPQIKGSVDTRRTFLGNLSKELNQKKIGFNTIYDEKKSTSPKSSIGKISFVGETNAIVCKYTNSSTETDEGKVQLKPSNITPSIVDGWLTPEVIAKNVQTYVRNNNLPKPISDQVNLLLKNSLTTDRSFLIDGDVDNVLVPAEFFEILTAIKMAVLLRNNETEIKTVLKFLDKSKKIDYKFSNSSPLKIHIPKQSNYPLTDYEISFKPNNYDETVKVSVKSKVKSDNTNTLKLNQIFSSVSDVGHWYRSLNASMKKEQFAQAQIAFAHLRYASQSAKGNMGKPATKKGSAVAPKSAEKYAGKVKVGFPIDAVGHILQISSLGLDRVIMQRSVMSEGTLKRKPNAKEIKMLGIVCRKVARVISQAETKNHIDKILTKKSEQRMLNTMVNLISSNNEVNNKPSYPDLINLGKYCEKILEWASKDTSPTKLYNFYEMFHKKVLQERAICYAISDSKKHKTTKGIKTEVIFKFETMINWDKMWIGMRKKDGDALGLDL